MKYGECPAVVVIRGAPYRCEVRAPHDGMAHANEAAGARWTQDQYQLARRAAKGRKNKHPDYRKERHAQ